MPKNRIALILLIIILGLSSFAVTVWGLMPNQQTLVINTLTRNEEPVIVSGNMVSLLNGRAVDSLFVYAYQNGLWEQIPFQIDELTAAGEYTAMEDNLLDSNDQIVFMAKDLGHKPLSGTLIFDSLPISSRWYEIEVSNPLSPTQKGWAYVVHSTTVTPTNNTDYIDFDSNTHQLNSAVYGLGFATPKSYANRMIMSNTNILDRSKSFLDCSRPLLGCPITEEDTIDIEDNLIKDGPVRVIMRKGRVLAYQSMVSWSTAITIPQLLQGDMRFSLDFSPVVSGATIYNSVTPNGVIVDGQPDAMPAQPASAWAQLSSSYGTLIQVADNGLLGGTLSNYYLDDATLDPDDTGDRRHYGEIGIEISNPDSVIAYNFNLYFLPPAQANLGPQYEAYFKQPLSVVAASIQGPLQNPVYLPLVIKQE